MTGFWRLLLVLCAFAATPLAASDLGQRLFKGEEPLAAHLRHSDFDLPPTAATCSNCHKLGCGNGDAVAPALGPDHLLRALKRGSGPAVAYDEAGFCRVLQTGRTPSHTVVLREMPLFKIDAPQCAALWAYLTGEVHACD